MTQPAVSKHLRVLREAGFVEATVDAQRRLYRSSRSAYERSTSGSRRFASCGRLTATRSSDISIAWMRRRPRNAKREALHERS